MTQFNELLVKDKTIILDGGFGSELEKRAIDLDNNLWSASALIQSPDTVKEIHQDYLNSGAEILITDTYQANPKTFTNAGISEEQAFQLIDVAVQQAKAAIKASHNSAVVAGSVGPYGAFLANGAEYTGDYSLSSAEYKAFHRPQIARLIANDVDLIALETLPNFEEAKALAELLQDEFPLIDAYFSFSTEAGDHLWDGTKLSEAVAYFEPYQQIKAIGINCTAPENILIALGNIVPNTTKKVIVYPNAGEIYDPISKAWLTKSGPINWQQLVPVWQEAGADIIGGCCRTSPTDIKAIYQAAK
ncbi:homocysteine S-methyltransferase [Leuconostoc miyukkimchii]|uniref:homocysteine S-methyltransferase n=1 Tax=Leuconostoc miyukkimchii TaxID=910540 RepID=UPI001C7DFDA4|nr:homocysteine S-methyltransferase [Leuconostoc miyukkimchii]